MASPLEVTVGIYLPPPHDEARVELGVVGAGIAIPLIAVGIGVTAIVEIDKRRHRDDR